MTLSRSLGLLSIAVAIGIVGIVATRSYRSRPDYVGSTTCRDCHAAEYKAWQASDHSRAMLDADSGSVLGNFDNARFTHGNVTSTFFRRDGAFWVRTDGRDGTLQDFEIKYTFGVSPLQQYLIELPSGRLQALSIAWDSRPKNEGGQRWFHLYPHETIDHTNELHWTGLQQNWNFMCADCHSTNLRKQYDAANDRFQTTWSEIDIACETCHGPGARHVTWARSPAASRSGSNGLRASDVGMNICAQCHSRRSQIAEGFTAGAAFEDYYVPELITPGLYYADGQQRDEVYIYASFLQSRMAQKGVKCADCHDPHSEQLHAAGNVLCAKCHAPQKYDRAAHHFHPAESAGAQCVSCHMPATTYMVVDPRRDHSFRVPRPDRSVRIGVPNPCTGCHRDRTDEWADEKIRSRAGGRSTGFQTFAEAFAAAESNEPGSVEGLCQIADDAGQPAIVRASALARLVNHPARLAVDTAARHVADPDPSVRRAALMVLESLPPDARPMRAAPLLRDPVRSVRLQAAWLLAPASQAFAGTPDQAPFTRAVEEFIASRRYRADRPEDRTTLGVFLTQLGRPAEAIDEYHAALRLLPRYTPAYINLADLQRDRSEREAEQTLRSGVAIAPGDAMLHYALGLSLARSGRQAEALQQLKRATDLSNEVQFTYAYAVALHSSGDEKDAIDALERARGRMPRNRDVLVALATFHRDAGRIGEALQYAEQLQAFYPDDTEASALVRSLRSSLPAHRPQ